MSAKKGGKRKPPKAHPAQGTQNATPPSPPSAPTRDAAGHTQRPHHADGGPIVTEMAFNVYLCVPCHLGEHAECTGRACHCNHEPDS